MKAHQVEVLKFLCSNLLADDPGGCILAHAPDKRSQQLDVLEQWVKQRSILFLGYKQFSVIVSDNVSNKVAADCKDVLIKVPTLLILDDGHLPRNEEIEVLQCLVQVQTPLKVILSGKLYQNHVKEVFNILNLVRPKFLKFKTCREIVNRIMSRVQIPKMRSHTGTDSAFFDLVEYTLQNDEDLRTRKAAIQNLREITCKVLHFYKGDFLDELPELVDFTVVLNLSARQNNEVLRLRKLSKFKQTSVGSALYMHPKLKCFLEKYPASRERGLAGDDVKIDTVLDELGLEQNRSFFSIYWASVSQLVTQMRRTGRGAWSALMVPQMPRSSLDQSKHAERNLLEFEAKTADVNEYDDVFFESPGLREDLKVLYKR
ncbi:hypothetical protein H0E87_008278 [Populus deltoides]|uniref:SNF2 N-terminal domain-containing protein n=1 Tax=Populus deltoides TaxID=3696 RepID=A0A8T2Z009_POPDE|nr:hypothetical protein H0E87_008278 [Populus deltoides]